MEHNDIPDILKKILQQKINEIAEKSHQQPLQSLEKFIKTAPAVRDFVAAIRKKLKLGKSAVIAEIKKASPSKGVFREDFQPAAIAASYEKAGAACLSVLTDEQFFLGSNDYLSLARNACSLPVLRKDFIIDPYQIYESRVIGADCILLIVAALDDRQLKELSQVALKLNMSVLVEVHNLEELERALLLDTPLLGINNRDLHTFNTCLDTTYELAQQVPEDCIVISESGIKTRDDVLSMHKNKVKTFLIGESMMAADEPGAKLAELFTDL